MKLGELKFTNSKVQAYAQTDTTGQEIESIKNKFDEFKERIDQIDFEKMIQNETQNLGHSSDEELNQILQTLEEKAKNFYCKIRIEALET